MLDNPSGFSKWNSEVQFVRIVLFCLFKIKYLKRKSVIDDGMYNYVVNKLMNKIELEKSKIDDDYINNIDNYKILV